MLNIVNSPIPLAALTGELKNLRSLKNRGKLSEHASYFSATMTIILFFLFAAVLVCFSWARQALKENRDTMGRPNYGDPTIGGWRRLKENITKWIVPNFGTTGAGGANQRNLPDLHEYVPLASPRRPRGNSGPIAGEEGGTPPCPSQNLPGHSHLGSTIHDGTVTKVNIENNRSKCGPHCTPKVHRNPTYQTLIRK